jgi:signal transduction histidine kinase
VNTPLAWMTTNLGYVKEALLQRGEVAPAGEPSLADILEETQRGASRIHALVEALRAASGRIRPGATAAFDPRAELLAALAAVRDDIVARAKLVLAVDEALPPVMSREGALREMFVHLLTNAAQAIPEGSPAANVVSVAARSDGRQVIVEVTDSGVGMTVRERSRMFDPFYTTRGAAGGLGLGATVARAVAEAAGGRIEVDSDPDRGTTVRVVLPAAPPGPGP